MTALETPRGDALERRRPEEELPIGAGRGPLSSRTGFRRFAWINLLYNFGVILWGAFVRATGSGAGCGEHWPLCNGVVVPREPTITTLIELTHRLTSGVALILVVILAIWAWRAFEKGHPVRLGASLSVGIMIVEALLGAGLVLFGLVDDNATIARAFAMVLHLVNTLFLVAALGLTAWWASGGRPIRLQGQGVMGAMFLLSVAAMLTLGGSGAIAALGDTLFPAGSLREGIAQDFHPTAHFLLRLRIFHPLIAMGTGAYILLLSLVAALLRPRRSVRLLALSLVGLFLLQLAVGLINLVLLAPVWLQLVHLLMADLVWLALVFLAAASLAVQRELAPDAAQHPRAPAPPALQADLGVD